MKGSLLVISFLILGILVGYYDLDPEWLDSSACSTYILYLLLGVIGFEFGHKELEKSLKVMTVRILLFPVATIVGTLAFTAVAGLIMGQYTIRDYLALGSGFGYYSVSSILIMQLREASVGVQVAAELGTIALLTNIIREVIALGFAPLFRKMGKLIPITVAGADSTDVVLPLIMRICGPDVVPLSIIHGIILNIMVPVLVTYFCS